MDFTIEDNILKGVEIPYDIIGKIGDIIFDILSENPYQVTQIDAESGEQITCKEMKDRSIRCALWMKKLPICPTDIVVVVNSNHVDCYVPIFATFFMDAVFCSWDHRVSLDRTRSLMKQLSPKLIFADADVMNIIVEAATLENLNVELVTFEEHQYAHSLNDIMYCQSKNEVITFEVVDEKSLEDMAVILPSSDTTELSKAIMLSGKSIVALPERQDKSDTKNNYLWYSTAERSTSISYILYTLVENHIRLVGGKSDVESFLQYVDNYEVDIAFATPSLVIELYRCNTLENYHLKSLAHLILVSWDYGRTILDKIMYKFPNLTLEQNYGPPEVGLIACRTSESIDVLSKGFVTPNCQIKFVGHSQNNEALGPHDPAEIMVKSPYTMIGYYENYMATELAFDKEGWFRTGDCGYYNEAGEIFVISKLEELIEYQEKIITPSDIEEMFMFHPMVKEVAVVAVPNENDGQWATAFVKVEPNSPVTEDDLEQMISDVEDCKKLRGGVHFVEKMPRTAYGGYSRYELTKLAKEIFNGK